VFNLIKSYTVFNAFQRHVYDKPIPTNMFATPLFPSVFFISKHVPRFGSIIYAVLQHCYPILFYYYT